jgi:CheY-like chemotaxis protein
MNTCRLPQRRILVVDDEPLVCETVTLLLRIDGHQVHTAASGEEALALFQPGKFDVVFTDYFMPTMTGGQLASAIKSQSPGQPIVLLTAFAERFRPPNEALVGIDLVMDKPLPMDGLRDAVARFTPPVQNLETSPSQN